MAAARQPSGVGDRILRAFGERVRGSGIRAVVMAELARDLGISTRTLYRHFPTKSDLVLALTRRWAERLEEMQRRRFSSGQSPLTELHAAAQTWVGLSSELSSAYWLELERDHPEAHAILVRQVGRNMGRARRRLAPLVREGLDPDVALRLLRAAVAEAADPAACEALGVTRQEATRTAIEIWARGALRGGGRLRAAPAEDEEPNPRRKP